jgi:hypothetical protein
MVPSENRRLTVSRSQLAEILACRAVEAVFCRNFSDRDTKERFAWLSAWLDVQCKYQEPRRLLLSYVSERIRFLPRSANLPIICDFFCRKLLSGHGRGLLRDFRVFARVRRVDECYRGGFCRLPELSLPAWSLRDSLQQGRD